MCYMASSVSVIIFLAYCTSEVFIDEGRGGDEEQRTCASKFIWCSSV